MQFNYPAHDVTLGEAAADSIPIMRVSIRFETPGPVLSSRRNIGRRKGGEEERMISEDRNCV